MCPGKIGNFNVSYLHEQMSVLKRYEQTLGLLMNMSSFFFNSPIQCSAWQIRHMDLFPCLKDETIHLSLSFIISDKQAKPLCLWYNSVCQLTTLGSTNTLSTVVYPHVCIIPGIHCELYSWPSIRPQLSAAVPPDVSKEHLSGYLHELLE